MEKNNTEHNGHSDFRKREKARVDLEDLDVSHLNPDEAGKLFYELRTHQIELEMQNEELRTAQEELVEARDQYSDLFDFAPVGYATISHAGLILRANLTLAEMLEVERQNLARNFFSAFIAPESQDDYYRFRREVPESERPGTCRLRMLRREADPLWVEMELVLMKADDGNDPLLRATFKGHCRTKGS